MGHTEGQLVFSGCGPDAGSPGPACCVPSARPLPCRLLVRSLQHPFCHTCPVLMTPPRAVCSGSFPTSRRPEKREEVQWVESWPWGLALLCPSSCMVQPSALRASPPPVAEAHGSQRRPSHPPAGPLPCPSCWRVVPVSASSVPPWHGFPPLGLCGHPGLQAPLPRRLHRDLWCFTASPLPRGPCCRGLGRAPMSPIPASRPQAHTAPSSLLGALRGSHRGPPSGQPHAWPLPPGVNPGKPSGTRPGSILHQHAHFRDDFQPNQLRFML